MSNETVKGAEDHHHVSESEPRNVQPPEIDFNEFPPSTYERWKEEATAALKGASFDKSMFTPTYEGIQLEPLYTKEHAKNAELSKTYPGSYPLRGESASGNIVRPWEIVQPCDEKLPAEARRQIEQDLKRGATTVAAVLDANTLKGIDEAAEQAGVCLSSIDDVEELLSGLFDRPLHLYAGESAAPLLGFIAALAEKENFDLTKLEGCIGADPLGDLLETGRSRGLDDLFDEMASTLLWTEKHAPHLRTVLIRGSVFHNGGANAVQEVAYAMTSAIEAVRAMQDRGLDVGVFARHLRFEFSLGSNFFMEIAKIRAARSVWAQIAESFGGDAAARKTQIFGRTSLFTKTIYDPYVNMLRNTTEAFSGVVGGVDGLTVGCFDEAFKPGGEFSRRVARNSQVLLPKEFNLLQPVDPAGGSWYLETLTDQLSCKIWTLLQEVEGAHGFSQCARAGAVQKAIEAVLQERFKKLAKRSDRAVGINMYPNPSEPLPEAGTRDFAALSAARSCAVASFRASRTEEDVQKALKDVPIQTNKEGLIASIAVAARLGATLGDVRAALDKSVEDDFSVPALYQHRWTEQYEALRRRTEDYKARTGHNVKVFLANMGPIPQHKARADFITSFMEVAAFDILKNNGYPTPEECAEAAAQSGADLAVICSTDATYPELVPPLARALKGKCPKMGVYLAGAPAEEFKDSYLQAGVNDFISVRSDCLATLTGFQKTKGMF